MRGTASSAPHGTTRAVSRPRAPPGCPALTPAAVCVARFAVVRLLLLALTVVMLIGSGCTSKHGRNKARARHAARSWLLALLALLPGCACADAPLTLLPPPSLPASQCDTDVWPDKDHGLVCGPCKVLVNHFSSVYGNCDGYCANIGRQCVGAWEEVGDTCTVSYQMACDAGLSSSDAICECSGGFLLLPPPSPPSSPPPAPPPPPPPPSPPPPLPQCDTYFATGEYTYDATTTMSMGTASTCLPGNCGDRKEVCMQQCRDRSGCHGTLFRNGGSTCYLICRKQDGGDACDPTPGLTVTKKAPGGSDHHLCVCVTPNSPPPLSPPAPPSNWHLDVFPGATGWSCTGSGLAAGCGATNCGADASCATACGNQQLLGGYNKFGRNVAVAKTFALPGRKPAFEPPASCNRERDIDFESRRRRRAHAPPCTARLLPD